MNGLSPKENRLLKQIETALNDDTHWPRLVRERVPLALGAAVEQFRTHAKNRNGAGVTRAASQRTQKLLNRVLGAMRHSMEHDDGNIRREAKRLVRSVQNLTFEEIEDRGKRFHGLLLESGRRRNEKQQRNDAWRMTLSDGSELVEVTTVSSLRSVGRQLGNCVANLDDRARDYHDAMRNGWSRFFTWHKRDEMQCLIEMDTETRKVEEVDDDFRPRRKEAVCILN